MPHSPAVHRDFIVTSPPMAGRDGFANAWHTHFMVNGRGTLRGVGDRDPLPLVRLAIEHR